MKNRSVPVDTVLPHIVYRNVADAIAWLTKTFGFTEHYRYGDPAQGAQMHLGEAWIMLEIEKFFEKWPKAVRTLISQRFPIDQASIPLWGKAGGIKNVIVVSS